MKSFKFVLVVAVIALSISLAFAEIVIPAKRVASPSLAGIVIPIKTGLASIVIPIKRDLPALASIVIPIKPKVVKLTV